MLNLCVDFMKYMENQTKPKVIWNYVGGLSIVEKKSAEMILCPTILKIESFSKDSVYIAYETKPRPIFRDFFM